MNKSLNNFCVMQYEAIQQQMLDKFASVIDE